jgi:hypothetical protein
MDEFLALSDSPVHSMRSLIMLFSAFRFLSHKELSERLDLRICQGIGPVEYRPGSSERIGWNGLQESHCRAWENEKDPKDQCKRPLKSIER